MAHEVCPIDLEEHAPEVSRLNAERGECNRRREVLHRELWHCENRLEEVEVRLDDIHAPIASYLTMATDEVVREEDFRSATDCFPLRNPIHLRWAVRTREALRCLTDGDRLRIRVTAELTQFLAYCERSDQGHLDRHDESCYLPRAFDEIHDHYTSRLGVIHRNELRARDRLEQLNNDLAPLLQAGGEARESAEHAAQSAVRAVTAAAVALSNGLPALRLAPANGTTDQEPPAPHPASTLGGDDSDDGAGGAARGEGKIATARPPVTSASPTEGPKAAPPMGGRPRSLALSAETPCANERLLRDGLMLSVVEWRLLVLWVLACTAIGGPSRSGRHAPRAELCP